MIDILTCHCKKSTGRINNLIADHDRDPADIRRGPWNRHTLYTAAINVSNYTYVLNAMTCSHFDMSKQEKHRHN